MGVKVTLEVGNRPVLSRRRERGVLQLTGKKTLSEIDVEALKALGCEIKRIQPQDRSQN